ncbi:(2Fe-2S)-binding protein [Pseudonocardia kujensis]|uniref:(2Fe-2S)-binding protein n=1 Tax=Pseudonocardia kujensis TaxID=1128675 RepID=UPI001E549A31|nr:(2Fe-2S)-binding protein [Pseudonocardia kujensis]
MNGEIHSEQVSARTSLLDWLREHPGLTGAKKGCAEGACGGACTVLVDGVRMNSCLVLVAQCHGSNITTIEGLADVDGVLHPVQKAFIGEDAFQCGYCTPAQIMSAVASIRERHTSSAEEVQEWMSGNLCHCSAYPQITAAVLAASKKVTG